VACCSVDLLRDNSLLLYFSSHHQAHLADGVATLRRATEAVRQLGLFSRNEEADDVATGELKYLLLPFLLAQVRNSRMCVRPTPDTLWLTLAFCCVHWAGVGEPAGGGPHSTAHRCARATTRPAQETLRLSLCRATEGQQCLEHFLLQCESYGLVPVRGESRARVDRGLVTPLPVMNQANAKAVRERVEPADPGTARAEKIARFKRDKEVRFGC
jgi:hypothetical protein